MRMVRKLWMRAVLVGAVLLVVYVVAGLVSLKVVNAPLYSLPPGTSLEQLDPRMRFGHWAYYSTDPFWNTVGYYFFWPVHKALRALPGGEGCGFVDDEEWLKALREYNEPRPGRRGKARNEGR